MSTELSDDVRSYFRQQISNYCANKKISIFFSYIQYRAPISLWPTHTNSHLAKYVLLITGISDSAPIVQYVQKKLPPSKTYKV